MRISFQVLSMVGGPFPPFLGEGLFRILTAVFLLSSWLFEGLGRDKAEELLQLPDTKVGSFMIRESETKKGEWPPTHLSPSGADKHVLFPADSLYGFIFLPPTSMQIDPM